MAAYWTRRFLPMSTVRSCCLRCEDVIEARCSFVSWLSGAQLFGEIWPLVEGRIRDRRRRQEFLRQMLALFLEWDVDPETVADVHAEVREALAALGVEVDEPSSGDDVAASVRQLSSPVEKARVSAAEALEFFVHQADNPAAAAGVALGALASAMRDTSVKVRRAAADSIVELVAADFALPSEARKKLTAAASDEDEVVRKRVALIMKQVEKSKKRRAVRNRRMDG
jgi:adenine-specific DNA methylase